MAGASPTNKAAKPPDADVVIRMWLMTKKQLVKFAHKVMQVVVGTGFLVVLHTLAFIAWLQRLFWTPAALQKSRRRVSDSAQAIDVPLALAQGTAALDDAAGEKDVSKQPTIVIKAIATAPRSIQPLILHNDPAKGHDSQAWLLVGPYMKLYGRNAIANSQLFNPEFIHFFVPGMGSLPYIVADLCNRVVVTVIGDPLSHKSNWRTITEMFIKEFPNTYFYHASADYSSLLHDMGYYINDVGAETTLQIQSWTYTAKTRTVRAAARSARDAGVRIRELKPEELTDELRRMLQHEVSGDWLQQKAVADRELRVFVRNVDYDNLQLQDGVRLFVAEQYDPATAPPAAVDAVLQGVPSNVKPPKPPRNKSSRSLASQASVGSASLISQASGPLSRSNSSMLTPNSSTNSLPSLLSCLNPCLSPAAAADGSSSAEKKSETAAISKSLSTGQLRKSESGAKLGVTFAPDVAGAGAGVKQNLNTNAAAGSRPVTPVMPSPFQSSDAAAAAAAYDEEAAPPAGPELVGFVLLDPLWENGTEIGYVSSICRMKRSAHQGTLKLLYEDIISKLRSEGKRELAFGFAPFFNVRDDRFPRIAYWIRWTNLYLFHFANNLYAFQNLAFSKIRYGAGVDGDKFKDPNVSMTHIYMAANSPMPGMQVLDLYVLCMYVGFMGEMFDTWLKLVGLKKGGANLVVDPLLTSPSMANPNPSGSL